MYSIEKRVKESQNIISKYPDRIPVICEKNNKDKNLPELPKSRMLVPRDLTMSNLITIIRNKLKLEPSYALFITIDNTIPASTVLMGSLYDEFTDADGFLYVTYSQENTFGFF
jgi:GABA(A) receptor-associated protein